MDESIFDSKLEKVSNAAWISQLKRPNCQKSLVMYKMKMRPPPEIFYDNYEVFNVIFGAKLCAILLRWRRHRLHFLTPGKLCPVFAGADETLARFLHKCKRLPFYRAFFPSSRLFLRCVPWTTNCCFQHFIQKVTE